VPFPDPREIGLEQVVADQGQKPLREHPLRTDDSGATAIEYALIITFISITVVSWATFVGTTISGFFTSIANGM
jgi:pilus assembly protein Flp/PilA